MPFGVAPQASVCAIHGRTFWRGFVAAEVEAGSAAPRNLATDSNPGDEPDLGWAFRLGVLIADPGIVRIPEVSVMRFNGLIRLIEPSGQ